MKAAIFHQPGQPHSFEEVDIDQPQGREVLVRTAACGVCHSDASVAECKVPVPTPMILAMSRQELSRQSAPTSPNSNPAIT